MSETPQDNIVLNGHAYVHVAACPCYADRGPSAIADTKGHEGYHPYGDEAEPAFECPVCFPTQGGLLDEEPPE